MAVVERETIVVSGVRLTQADVAGILALVTGIASDSGTRPVLTNVRIEASNDQLIFVATDGFRLTKAEYNAPTHWQGAVLVNAQDLAIALKTEKLRKYETLALGVNADGCYVEKDTRHFIPAQEGRYPAYQVIMPRVDKKALLSKDTILEACAVSRALQTFDDGYVTMVTIETTEDGGTISVGGSNKGRSDVTWTWESKGQDVGRVTFNPDLLRQPARALPSHVTGLTMEWSDKGYARLFQIGGNTGTLDHVLMPMHVSDSR